MRLKPPSPLARQKSEWDSAHAELSRGNPSFSKFQVLCHPNVAAPDNSTRTATLSQPNVGQKRGNLHPQWQAKGSPVHHI